MVPSAIVDHTPIARAPREREKERDGGDRGREMKRAEQIPSNADTEPQRS